MKRELRTCDVCGNEWDHHDGFVLKRATSGSSAIDLCSPACLEQWAKKTQARNEAMDEWLRHRRLAAVTDVTDITDVTEPA